MKKTISIIIILIIGSYIGFKGYTYSHNESINEIKHEEIKILLKKYKSIVLEKEEYGEYGEFLSNLYEYKFIKYNKKEKDKLMKLKLKYLKDGNDQGDIVAKKRLADLYYYGDGIEKDKEKAIVLYKELYKRGDSISTFILGFSYFGLSEENLSIEDIIKIKKKGLFYIEESKRLGLTTLDIGGMYYRFVYPYTKDKEEALKYFKESLNESKKEIIDFCKNETKFCKENNLTI